MVTTTIVTSSTCNLTDNYICVEAVTTWTSTTSSLLLYVHASDADKDPVRMAQLKTFSDEIDKQTNKQTNQEEKNVRFFSPLLNRIFFFVFMKVVFLCLNWAVPAQDEVGEHQLLSPFPVYICPGTCMCPRGRGTVSTKTFVAGEERVQSSSADSTWAFSCWPSAQTIVIL